MNDLISRCKLFDQLAVIPAPPEANEYKAEVYKAINGADPVPGCGDCKHYTVDGICVQWSRYGFQPEDYCSRWEGRE